MKYEDVRNCPECGNKPDIMTLNSKLGLKIFREDVDKKKLIETRGSFLKYQGYASFMFTCVCDNFTDENFIREAGMCLSEAVDKWNNKVDEYLKYKNFMVDTTLSV